MGALLVMGGLVVPSVAGAQVEPTVESPGYCPALRDLVDSANQLPTNDEEFAQQLSDGTRLLVELRAVAPAELLDDLDALEAFSVAANSELAAVDGVAGLAVTQRLELISRSELVLEPINAFYEQSCPGANIGGLLYPECNIDEELWPPALMVFNNSSRAVEVLAGETTFTVGADDFEDYEVSADLKPGDVLIDGIAGLVRVGPCDDFGGPIEEEFADNFSATFIPGCPDSSPPTPPRLVLGLTPLGQASLDSLEEDLGRDPGLIPVYFQVNGDAVIVDFPGGLNLILPADAEVPEVGLYIDGIELVVAIAEADCSPATPPSSSSEPPPSGSAGPSSSESAPSGSSGPSQSGRPSALVGGPVAKPLAPRFTA
jgi:hypothetical protein